jgi:hypothetical protein
VLSTTISLLTIVGTEKRSLIADDGPNL